MRSLDNLEQSTKSRRHIVLYIDPKADLSRTQAVGSQGMDNLVKLKALIGHGNQCSQVSLLITTPSESPVKRT